MSDAHIRTHQSAFLEKLKAVTKPYLVEVEGVEVMVAGGVFPPTTDTRLLARHITAKSGERVLDVTCGSGVLAVIAGMRGASGIANDLNPAAVANARENIARSEVDFVVTEGDLFENVPLEKFNYIYSNGPYLEGEISDPLELAFYGARKYVANLFGGAKDRLASEGKMLITFAEWGDTAYFEETAHDQGFAFEVIDTAMSNDQARNYLLYELSLRHE